jgi:predicted TIM-barrel fold metal-dependent hydrolase
MNRRRFFAHLATTAAAAAPIIRAAETARRTDGAGDGGLIDTNVYLSHWAVRHSWVETTANLVTKLQRHGVTSAWVGNFDGALHSDIAGVNTRLADACARDGAGILRAFGTINPTLPDWEEDLRRCHEVHRMPGVRLFPNYHGYTLEDPRFAKLLELASRRSLLVQIPLTLEDDRSQNPALTAPPVQAAPLPEVLSKFPAARVMLLNCGARALVGNDALLARLVTARVSFDLATLEGVAGLEGLFKRAPGTRVTFGSHTPYFYFEAALLKLQESALSAEQLAAVRFGNARAALA